MTTQLFNGPLFTALPERTYTGPVERYDMETRARIPAQWEAYNQTDQRAPSPGRDEYFGLVYDYDEGTGAFDYMSGQVLTPGGAVPVGFGTLRVPAGKWARFVTDGHISTMQSAWAEIMNHWMAQPDCRPRKGPSIEFYPPQFDSTTGAGGYEIWMPVE